LAERPDSEIDYSDIPPLDEKFWQNAVPNPFYRQTGKGYQSRINAILRDAMLRSIREQKV